MVMTQEEIKEYNQLCAEFLGITKGYFSDEIDTPLIEYQWMATSANCTFSMEKDDYPNKTVYDYLKFHSDYNWIMEVIKKINTLTISSHKHKIKCLISGTHCVISYESKYEHTIVVKATTRGDGDNIKEIVVKAIYQFLKWYKNENKN